MRNIPDSLSARLGDATTLCHCWRLLLRDGSRIGFTDHDLDITFDGVTYAAASGLDSSDVETAIGFSSAGGEVAGALFAASLTEEALASGRYDGATIETWLLDWGQVDARVLLDVACIGEVTRSDTAFTAELRSLAQVFDEPRGRLFQAGCAADLGDLRCGVKLEGAPLRVACTVLAVESATALRLSLTGQSSGWFSNGSLYAADVRLGTIRDHTELDGSARVILWGPVASLLVGASVYLTAGCDKSFDACRTKFANQANFRGFPHMPGNDLMLGYINAGAVGMDGGSLFR